MPVMQAKPIYYRPDGSGRDNYIDCNSGGQFSLTRTNFDFKESFKKSLRSYERVPVKARAARPIYSAYAPKRGPSDANARNTQYRYGGSTAVITTYS